MMPFACHRNACFILILTLAGQLSAVGQDRLEQQLERVNQLLRDIRQTAPLPQHEDAVTEPPRTAADNPFLRSPAMVGRRTGNESNGSEVPGVILGTDTIEITVGGRTIQVDRPNTGRPGREAENNPGTPVPDTGPNVSTGHEIPAAESAMDYAVFGRALARFADGEYQQAASMLSELKNHNTRHSGMQQIHGLVLFQVGNYEESAALVYDGLHDAPVMRWSEVAELYHDTAAYAAAYRDLQTASRNEPERLDLHFLLVWHHLMLGHREHAAAELQVVRSSMPQNAVIPVLERALQVEENAPPQPLSR